MVGEILKKRREELGQDLKEIAHTLKIRYDYLKALEAEDFEKLPVPVYTKGYIRDYAKFLDINPDIIIKAYMEKISPPVIEKSLPDETAKEKKPVRKYIAVFIILLAIAGAYFLFSSSPAPKKREITKTEKTAPSAQPEQPAQHAGPVQEKEVKRETALTVKKTEEGSKKERPEITAWGHVLDVSATDTTWLLVKIDDTETKDMLLKQGESVRLSAKQGFSLKIGNAGGTKLIYDGKDIGALGEKGQVINLSLPSDKNANPDTPRTD